MNNILEALNKQTTRNQEMIVFLLYLCCVLTIAGHHEAWRDEAQAWLLSRDLSFFQLINHISYEGTPALWHLILMLFSKTGFPYETIKYINITIIAFSAFVFLRFSPFTLLTKTLFIFSYYMAWEYSIIARSYSVSIAIIFSIAGFYHLRFTRPIVYALLVFVLFNTNAHSFSLAAAIGLLYLYESKDNESLGWGFLISVSIMACGAFLALYQLIPNIDNMHDWKLNIFAPPIALMNAFFPVTSYLEEQLAHKLYLTPLAFIAFLTFLYFILYLQANYRNLFFLYTFFVFGMISIFLFKNFGTYRHHGFILIILIFVLWVSKNYKKKKEEDHNTLDRYFSKGSIPFKKRTATLLLNIVLGFSLMGSAVMYYKEYTGSFSGSKKMAELVIDNGFEERVIVASSSQIMSSLLPYLPNTTFWYPDAQRFGTYIVWTHGYKSNRNLPFEEVERRAKSAGVLNKSTLVLLSRPMPDSYLAHYQLVNKSDEGVFGALDETYYLYKAKQVGAFAE
ncbi:MAG: Unknown protein [uncultured Thiotrichaceae bacterium]|uniref:Glycosyltransferase RgtA/B/C/D-like domain-containing protein n=1 Tax=uncultured Thiotrichaceae bacterium TaxID=298394 RepID=A0A6S6TWV8_9GAMM|nr:MAG: Unknown protein [uncultured Thiotrichaceae bacterium]